MSNTVPAGWNRTTLGKVAKLTMGQSPLSDTYNTESHGLPFFQGKADFGSRYPRIRYWCSEPTKVASEQSILFSVRAPVGEVNITPYECCIGRGLAGIYGETANQEFLFQKLQYAKPRFQLLSQGSTFEAVNGSDLKEFDLTLPPLPEQQKIATILSSVDDVIEKTRAQIDKLKDLKIGMMQELLTKGIGHTEFKDSPVGRIPEGWSLLVLDDMKADKKPILRTGPFGSSLKSKDFQSTGIPVINIQNLGVGRLERENIYFISKEKATELQGYTVNYGDLVFSRVADVGRSVVIPEYANGWVMSSNLMRISVDTDRIDPKYLMYQLVNGPAVMLQLRQMIADGGRPVVTGPLIKQINFPVPPLKEQCSIVKKIDSVDDALAINEEKSVLFSNLKKALMQDLLTGKVRVNLTDKESAVV